MFYLWNIEIFFKILKSGCEIEELQFESFSRIANCLALYMIVAWRILYVTMIGRHCPDISSDLIFDESEWKAVYAITQRKKPPEVAPKLDVMIKMIASLGGYLGRKHDSEPGSQVMWIGIQRMRDFAVAWEVLQELKL
jgi:Transposase Tn5 dimerisation domain